VTGIILCGGRSTRMGQDKSTLPFGKETMRERIERILRTICDRVILVGRRDQSSITTFDAVEDQGPLSGIAAGLSASTSDINIVVACDMPLINPVVLQRLVSRIGEHDVCVAIVDGHPSALCGVYRSRIADDAQRLFNAGERRLMTLLDAVQTNRIDADEFRDIDPTLDCFVSVDTPEKYAEALSRAGFEPSIPGP
jgi:molybdopterin-guanine dinucleotide biosynthesis protein A